MRRRRQIASVCGSTQRTSIGQRLRSRAMLAAPCRTMSVLALCTSSAPLALLGSLLLLLLLAQGRALAALASPCCRAFAWLDSHPARLAAGALSRSCCWLDWLQALNDDRGRCRERERRRGSCRRAGVLLAAPQPPLCPRGSLKQDTHDRPQARGRQGHRGERGGTTSDERRDALLCAALVHPRR